MAPLRSPERTREPRASRSVLAWSLGLLVVAVIAAGIVTAVGVVDWERVQQARDVGRLGGTPTIPSEYEPIIDEAADRCPAVPSRVLAAQIAIESSWQTDAESPVGAQGIAQFMPSTWSQYGIDANDDGVRDVWDPEDAIHSAAALNCLNRELVADVSGTPLHNILAAYNAGHGAVRKYDGVPPFPETEQYVKKVLDLAQRLPAPNAG
jgi:soluble lytic murein transglycosylase-like protein